MSEILKADAVSRVRDNWRKWKLGNGKACIDRLCDSHEALRAKLAEAEKEGDELRLVLIGVTPSHRRRGECWCGHSQDLANAGHTAACFRASQALDTKCGHAAIDAAMEGK